MEATSFIKPDNTWVLWAFMVGWAAISIYLEQRYQWASKISGAIIALIGAMVLANLNIIPTDAPAYDAVWTYVVPLAIPMLLFKCNITKIWKESGRLLFIFLIGAVGTLVGSILGYNLFKDFIPGLETAASIICASYIGGGVNLAAMADALTASGELVSAVVVADNLLMALYFFVLIAIPSVSFFTKKYRHPHMDQVDKIEKQEGETIAAAYWGRKEISLKDIAFTFATSVIIVAFSTMLAGWLQAIIPADNDLGKICVLFFGNKYLIITTTTMILATFASGYLGNIRGSQEIGTFLIYIFFVVIGVPASIVLIVTKSPMLLVYAATVVLVNMLFVFITGKLFKFDLEECVLASNANIGGPTTAAAMAISKGWVNLVGPVLLVGTLGYVIGNYFGLLLASILGA